MSRNVISEDVHMAIINQTLSEIQNRDSLNFTGDHTFQGTWTNSSNHFQPIKITLYNADLFNATVWNDHYGVQMSNLLNGFHETTTAAADKSGGFFKLSEHKDYMIKGIFSENIEAARKMLPSYFEYLANEPETTIVKLVAVFTGKIGLAQYHYCIMKNVFKDPLDSSQIFDLKGRLDRHSEPEGKISKEMEFLSQYDPEEALKLKFKIGQQIRRDIEFLKAQELFDYSILLKFNHKTVQVGIVDILTPYKFWRRPLGHVKRMLGRSSSGLPPGDYAERLLVFMKDFGFETGWKQLSRKWSKVFKVIVPTNAAEAGESAQ